MFSVAHPFCKIGEITRGRVTRRRATARAGPRVERVAAKVADAMDLLFFVFFFSSRETRKPPEVEAFPARSPRNICRLGTKLSPKRGDVARFPVGSLPVERLALGSKE